jgi:hypothetical protein
LVKVRLANETFPRIQAALIVGSAGNSVIGSVLAEKQPWGESATMIACGSGRYQKINGFTGNFSDRTGKLPAIGLWASGRCRRAAAIWRNDVGPFGASFREVLEDCLSFVMPQQHVEPAAGHGDAK